MEDHLAFKIKSIIRLQMCVNMSCISLWLCHVSVSVAQHGPRLNKLSARHGMSPSPGGVVGVWSIIGVKINCTVCAMTSISQTQARRSDDVVCYLWTASALSWTLRRRYCRMEMSMSLLWLLCASGCMSVCPCVCVSDSLVVVATCRCPTRRSQSVASRTSTTVSR